MCGCWIGRAFIENHHHIAAQFALYLNRLFRIDKYLAAIDRRLECHAALGDLAHSPEAKYLKAARIGQYRSLPLGEIVQIAVRGNHLGTGAQHQVKGVAKNNLGTDLTDIPGQHALDRTVSADRHKRRGLNRAAWKAQLSSACLAVVCRHRKVHKTATRNAVLSAVFNMFVRAIGALGGATGRVGHGREFPLQRLGCDV